MEVNGKVHCFFEQSGTFKNEFIKIGISAYDYDIQNNFGQTDYVIDLFRNCLESLMTKKSAWQSTRQASGLSIRDGTDCRHRMTMKV